MKNLHTLSIRLREFKQNKATFPTYDELAELVATFHRAQNEEISITWHVDDVAGIRPDLNADQCFEVLIRANDSHDANIGINWTVLEYCAEQLYPEAGHDSD